MSTECAALVIAAPASGQGKTTVTATLARYFRDHGKQVRVFKAGPDFLDPMILEQASSYAVYQLDLWMVGETSCRQQLAEAAVTADLILIEGVMGLFDGDPSTADLATTFGIPVLAVIDASAMAQTFAAIAYGLTNYRQDVPMAGVFANRIGSERHYQMLIDDIDWGLVRNLSTQGLTVKDLNKHLLVPERDLGMIETIHETISNTKNPRVLVFCRSIAHAERLRNFFRQFDISAGLIHSGLSRSEKFLAISRFRTGDLKVLISIEMLNEGIDVPEVNIVVFARVTHSRRIFLQQLGRGLRLYPNKEKVIVLDFVADVRRLAAGVELNNDARNFRGMVETVRYQSGEIVRFSSDMSDFFQQYLTDMSNISDLDENATLNFPDL